jgi:oligosaccharide repeat unit polymerase
LSIALLFLATIVGAYFAYAKNQYLLCFFLVVFAGYELLGPSLVLISYETTLSIVTEIVPDRVVRVLGWQFQNASETVAILAVSFLSTLVGSYLFWVILNPVRPGTASRGHLSSPSSLEVSNNVDAMIFLVILFICGLFSVYFQDGKTLAADYAANISNALEVYQRESGAEVSRALGLGNNLMPYGYAILLLWLFQRKNGYFVVGACLALLPMVFELAQAGRRQYFIAAAAIVFLVLHYLVPVRKRGVILVGTVFIVGAVTSFIFYNRAEYYSESFEASSWWTAMVIPTATELTGVSWITSNTASIVGVRDYDFGVRIFAGIADSLVPYAKLGVALTEALSDLVRKVDFVGLSPWGAFPILAEAYSSFGLYGGVIFGMIIGSICAGLHIGLRNSSLENRRLHIVLWLVAVAALFLVKYRSGLLDFSKSVVALTYLHLLALTVGRFVALIVKAGSSGYWPSKSASATQRILVEE